MGFIIFIWKRGESWWPGVSSNKFFKALTGHSGEAFKDGSFKIFIESLVCIVLLHFTIICNPGGAKKTSPLVSCSRGEKAEILCGTRLEIRKKEKKAIKYSALKICPIHIVSHMSTILLSRFTSMIFLIFAVNFLFKARDL